MTAHGASEIEYLAGDPAAGARLGEKGCRLLEEAGDRGWLATGLAKLGECYLDLGRLDEADECADRSAELGASDDVANEQQWRELKAKVLARRGELEKAEQLAREALAISRTLDVPDGFSLLTLSEVLTLAGKRDESAAAFADACESFEKKQANGLLEWARRRREALLLELEQ
jgi:ATP/maltotriose-dependent transcriptional regulator MalT